MKEAVAQLQTSFLESNPNQVTDYPIEKGLVGNTAITFDVGFVLNGYCSDWGRSLFFGSPDEKTKSAYQSLQEAVLKAISDIEVGKTENIAVS